MVVLYGVLAQADNQRTRHTLMPDTEGCWGCTAKVMKETPVRDLVYISSHLQMIEDTQRHSKTHVDDPDDYGHLHLVGVEEGQPVHRHVPYLTEH